MINIVSHITYWTVMRAMGGKKKVEPNRRNGVAVSYATLKVTVK